MKRIIVYILLLCCSASLMAQSTTVGGKVSDRESSAPLPFVTVAVMRADSSVVTGTVTDDNGNYSLEVKQKGDYLMAFSFIGYQTHYETLHADGGSLQMVPVALNVDATTLKAVQVTTKAPLLEQQMDKLVMNVAQSAFAQGNNALELLRKAPGVTIDKDGNVLLNGQAVAVWIDGRPSYLDGKSLEAMLRGTEGSSIDKIEIIANPSAKYDAAGQSGILNIKTRRSLRQGLNGNLAFNVGGMGYHREAEEVEPLDSRYLIEDLSLNLNYRTAKSNSFLQVAQNSQPMGTNLVSNTTSQLGGTLFEQHSSALFDATIPSFMLKAGSDWFIDNKNTLGFIFTMPMNGMHQWADTNVNRSSQMVGNVLSQQVMSYSNTLSSMRQYMGNLNFTHVFDEAQANELTANLDYMHNVSRSENDLDNYYLTPTHPMVWNGAIDSVTRMKLLSDNIVDVYSAKVDWQRVVMSRFMMEAGAKWALSMTDNQLTHTFQTVLPSVDATESITPFDYTEHIGAFYGTLAGQLSPQWTAKLGLRGEYTYASNSDNSVTQNYFNLFPTAFVGYCTKDMNHRINLSYTRRIQRPNYHQLDPFRNYVDAHTSNMGNPNLQPCLSDNIYLSYGKGQYLSLYANYMNMNHVITYIPKMDPTTGDKVMYADNFGNNTLIGGGLTLAELPLGKPFTLMVNMGAYDYASHSETTASLIVGEPDIDAPYNTHTFYGSAYACLTWKLPKSWKLQLDGWASTPVTSGYMHQDWNYSCNLGVKKSAQEGRLIFNLNFNDIFRTMNNSFSVVGNDQVVSHYSQRYLLQKVSVGLQWNFGTAQKPLKQRNVGVLDEADRTGGSKGMGANGK